MLFFEDTFKENKDAFDKILRLSPDEVKDPHKAIAYFFEQYSLAQVRELLYTLQRIALSTDNPEFSEPMDRGNLLFGVEKIEQLIEVAYVLKSQKDLTLNHGKGKERQAKKRESRRIRPQASRKR